MMPQLLFFPGAAKGGRTFDKTTDLHVEQPSNKRSRHHYRSNTASYKPIHPWAPAKFLCVHVVCVHHVWVYDIKRLSSASQTDRPELVNRCCWSSWGWGHGASSQSLIKEKLPQLPVITCNLIYVAVSENFMTACKSKDILVTVIYWFRSKVFSFWLIFSCCFPSEPDSVSDSFELYVCTVWLHKGT